VSQAGYGSAWSSDCKFELRVEWSEPTGRLSSFV